MESEQAFQERKTEKRRTPISTSALKLAVALRLREEGFVRVVFDWLVESFGRCVRVDVFGEDRFGVRVAVWCVTRVSRLDEDLESMFAVVRDGFGLDCQVAVAIPMGLVRHVDRLAGLADRFYMLDSSGKLWVHDLNGQMLAPLALNLTEEARTRLSQAKIHCSLYVV